MSDDPKDPAAEKTAQASARPSHVAYSVREASGGERYFNRVGAAFAHKDGQGFNLDLEAVPVNGRVVLRTPRERLDDMKAGGKAPARENEGHEK